MICFVGFILRSVYFVAMIELFFNYISALGTLNGVLLGSVSFMIRSMCCKIALLCAVCSLASVPVTACITGPRRSRIMRCQCTVLKGCRALFTASAGLVIGSLFYAGRIRCLVSFGCYFLVKHMDMIELCFDDISALGTLNSVPTSLVFTLGQMVAHSSQDPQPWQI